MPSQRSKAPTVRFCLNLQRMGKATRYFPSVVTLHFKFIPRVCFQIVYFHIFWFTTKMKADKKTSRTKNCLLYLFNLWSSLHEFASQPLLASIKQTKYKILPESSDHVKLTLVRFKKLRSRRSGGFGGPSCDPVSLTSLLGNVKGIHKLLSFLLAQDKILNSYSICGSSPVIVALNPSTYFTLMAIWFVLFHCTLNGAGTPPHGVSLLISDQFKNNELLEIGFNCKLRKPVSPNNQHINKNRSFFGIRNLPVLQNTFFDRSLAILEYNRT